MLKRIAVGGLVLLLIGVGGILYIWFTQVRIPDPQRYFQDPVSPQPVVTPGPIPQRAVAARADRQAAAAAGVGISHPKQILFGDMHVHSTYSADAFFQALPFVQGSRGAFPPADACDYARYVSQLDFYFLTDHAESYTPHHWRDQVESVRLCNDEAGDPHNPDLVAFIGWEWTQAGQTAETHYGHHNVLFRDTDPDAIPRRPIGAIRLGGSMVRKPPKLPAALTALDSGNTSFYAGFAEFSAELAATATCEEGVNTRDLPDDCFEGARTPRELFTKLDEWGFDTLVVPHGTTWGWYTPPGASWDYQLIPEHHDPAKTRLIEVYSGHGNSEQYRDWRAVRFDAEGQPYCPEPTPEYLPSCWQAGEIIRKRCLDTGEDAAECERRAAEARQNYVDVPDVTGFLTVPGAQPADWLDAGQARGMFLPAFNYRPAKSVQYGLARRNLDDADEPLGYSWGFVASSDNHTARPGTGFKEYDRVQATEVSGPANAIWERLYLGKQAEPVAWSMPIDRLPPGFRSREFERVSSYLSLGGLAAVHAEGRNREAIWDALKRREVYGTSGPRILLWFDLLRSDGEVIPMGGEVTVSEPPRFRVRAVGAFKQLPGCPEYVKAALSERRLQKLASGECYNPSDQRYAITRIEVVRIRPQVREDEPIGDLVDDPWIVLPCNGEAAGCTVEFDDPEFASGARDALYYVRALQEPTPIINAGGLRTTYDDAGNAIAVEPCYSGYKTPLEEECYEDAEHRAWSSPIYVKFSSGEQS